MRPSERLSRISQLGLGSPWWAGLQTSSHKKAFDNGRKS